MSTLDARKPLKHDNIIIREIEDELVLYDMNNDIIIALNHTAADILNLCDGKLYISQIANQIAKKSELTSNWSWTYFAAVICFSL